MASTPVPGAVQSSTPYRGTTFSPATSAWHAFHRRWWGSAGASLLDAAKESESRVVHVEAEPEVTAKLGLRPTSGAIYLRSELLHTYARAKRASTRFPSSSSGVAFLGQAGTGKSYLLVYLLLERMAAAQMTLFFTHRDNLVYLVDADGVRCVDAAFLYTDSIPASMYGPGSTWMLVDSSYDHSPPFPIIMSRILFTVHLSSFLLSEHRWTSKKEAVKCILDPWNDSEILESIRLQRDFLAFPLEVQERCSTLDDVSALVARSGRSPQAVIRELWEPGSTRAWIDAELVDRVRDVKALKAMLRTVSSHNRIEDNPLLDLLFVVRRDPRGNDLQWAEVPLGELQNPLASACLAERVRALGTLEKPRPHSGLAEMWFDRVVALMNGNSAEWQISLSIEDDVGLCSMFHTP